MASNTTALTDVLSAHLNQQNQTVVLAGAVRESDGTYVPGTDIELLTSAMLALTTTAAVPPAAHQLFNEIQANVSCDLIQTALCGVQNPHLMPATITLNNAFDVVVQIAAADLIVSVQNGSGSFAVGEWVLPSPQRQCNESADVVFDADATSVSAPICIDLFAFSYAQMAPVLTALLSDDPPLLSATGTLTILMSSSVESSDAYATVINMRAVDIPIALVSADRNTSCFVC